ncbi:hypothetical protein NEHOM01_0682 [Nematocida homosporus]|uniref:uncharacterized protein n=1 Tax=Nematocida homosporus TaxID=1912981 RepID=UPI00221FD97F|nr:uncharacterized protein NEHOM01_0682 [Nematocida homosporus]KAI5185224.1 hypothetical protein NEHOM01_0682 [Nematocida homosporus]
MNPFEQTTGASVDKRVLTYFTQIQKRSPAARNSGLERILNELEDLDIFSVEQCLFDVLPLLCRDSSETTQALISGILLGLLQKNAFDKLEERVHLWLTLFLNRPDKPGQRVIARLAKSGRLATLLAAQKQKCTIKEHIGIVLLEIKYLGVAEIDQALLERICKSGKPEDVEQLGRLFSKLDQIHPDIQLDTPALHQLVQTLAKFTNKEIVQLKWLLWARTKGKYALSSLEQEIGQIPEEIVLQLVQSEVFQELVQVNGLSEFLNQAKRIYPSLLPHLVNLSANRHLVLKRIIRTNPIAALEALEIEEEDFPYLNQLDETKKINKILQSQPKDTPFLSSPLIYTHLTPEEKICRADTLGHTIDQVDPTIPETFTIQQLRNKGILAESIRVFPNAYFKNADLTPEEEVYTAAIHPSLCSTQTIDLLFKHNLFPEEILVALPPSLHPYLVQRLANAPKDISKGIYEVVQANISPALEFIILSTLYQEPEYRHKTFTSTYSIPAAGIAPEYALYLLERQALEPTSLYKYLVAEANKCAAGTLDLLSDPFILEDSISPNTPDQKHSSYLFPGLYDRWDKVLAKISTSHPDAQLIRQVLSIQETLPDLSPTYTPPKWATEGSCLFSRVVRSLLFWQAITAGREPALLTNITAKFPQLPTTPIYSLYLNLLLSRPMATDDLADIPKTIESLKVTNCQERDILLFATVRVYSHTHKTSTSSLDLSSLWTYITTLLPEVSPRVRSYLLQHLPPTTALFALPFEHLSTQTLRHLQAYLAANPEPASLALKSDSFWTKASTSIRLQAYNPVLQAIAHHYANIAFNLYSISQVEQGAVDSEVFYLMFDIPAITNIRQMSPFEWRVFLMICNEIRSIAICTLLSAMVRSECQWLAFLIASETSDLDMLALFARSFPLLTRIFFQSSRRKQLLQRHFINQVSRTIIKEEVSRPLAGVNLKVKTIAQSHIIIATYHIEESVLEVNARFPQDYPLTTPEIKIISCIGVKKQKLQRLVLRIQMLLSEFCRIGEAMALWKVALDQSVNDEEECGICFFLLDEFSKTFPDTICPFCSNKYHQSCLRRWLQKSKNLCPTCRAEIRS